MAAVPTNASISYHAVILRKHTHDTPSPLSNDRKNITYDQRASRRTPIFFVPVMQGKMKTLPMPRGLVIGPARSLDKGEGGGGKSREIPNYITQPPPGANFPWSQRKEPKWRSQLYHAKPQYHTLCNFGGYISCIVAFCTQKRRKHQFQQFL
jgi:hypothetical protein